MFDKDAPSSQRALKELEKPHVRTQLLRMAKWRTRSEQDADDLVQNTLVRVLDPDDAPWVKYTFLAHMNFYMRQVWDQLMRKASAQRELLDKKGVAVDKNAVSPDPLQDEEIHWLRTLDLWRSLIPGVLDELVESHPLARPVYDLGARGIDKPADQALELGCEVDEIHVTQKAIAYHAKLALRKWERAEQRRMRDLREASARKKKETTNP